MDGRYYYIPSPLSREDNYIVLFVFLVENLQMIKTFCFLYSLVQFIKTLFDSHLTTSGCNGYSVLSSIAVDRGFDPLSFQTKDYKISICCFSAMHAALRSKSTGLLGIR